MAESATQKKVIEWIRSEGQYVVNIHGHEMQERGIPDLLCCWDGLFIGIELKEPGEEPDAIQQYHLNNIASANGYAMIAHSLEDVQEGIQHIRGQLEKKISKLVKPVNPSSN